MMGEGDIDGVKNREIIVIFISYSFEEPAGKLQALSSLI